MDIPVFIKHLESGEISALIPSVPAVCATGNSIGEAISALRANLKQTLTAHILAKAEVAVWLPPMDKTECVVDFSNGYWTSIEYKVPQSAVKTPIRFVPFAKKAGNQRIQPDRRRYKDRRLPEYPVQVQITMCIPATFYHASRMTQALRLLMEDRAPEETRNELEIGVMEAITNIVRHAYKDLFAGTIEVTYSSSLDGITIEFKDSGGAIPAKLFEPAGSNVFNFDETNTANLPEGGMGVALMHAVFDCIQYNHEDGVNHLSMFKRI